MSILSWGKPKLEYATSTGGEAGTSASWTELDTPKEDTTQLTTTAGEEVTATEEGGAVVDTRYKKTTYQLEFDLFVKKGQEKPFTDSDGVISGEYALRLTPEDESCEGILIDRCVIRVEESYTAADGKMMHFVCKALKPKTGNTVKAYTKS